MSKLRIYSIEQKGNLSNECVWIDVLEDISSLSHYMICDTTYTDAHSISNELRHMHWFSDRKINKGDWIKLFTKNGVNTTSTNNRGTTTHILHWNLGKTVWNKDGDAAVLFDISTWSTTRA